jgi:hypothetical protein
MSEEHTTPQTTESNESGLLLSVEENAERSLDFTALSDDTDTVDSPDIDTDEPAGDTDGTDGTDTTDTDATDDADGTD